jgi:hypothetical protein
MQAAASVSTSEDVTKVGCFIESVLAAWAQKVRRLSVTEFIKYLLDH